jgi:ABC-type dipeptide/oligopeptide/nickel transport system permease component
MVAVVARRVALTILLLAAFSFVSFYFFATDLAPLKGHPPLHEYWIWVEGLVNGKSFESLITIPYRSTHGESLWPIVLPAFAHTAVLLGVAIVLVVVLSIGVAYVGARWRGSVLDLVLRLFSYACWSIPAYLLAMLAQLGAGALGGSNGIGPFPLAGWPGTCPAAVGLNAGIISPCPAAGHGATLVLHVLTHVALPALVLAAGFVGLHGRYLRSSLIEQIDRPYIATARAKGLSERRVVFGHALRNALATFTSALFADFGIVFGAALAVDWVFQLGGIGTLLLHEFPQTFGPADIYAIELILIFTGAFVLISSLLADVAVAALDPRVRREH